MTPDYDVADARSEAEIDRLFREARALCQQSERERLQHGLAKSLLGLRLSAEEERLRAARARSAKLSRRAELLEGALHSHRAQYAACLRPYFRAGPLPVDSEECGAQSSESLGASRDDTAEPPGPAPPSWQQIVARVPRARKQPVRGELSNVLRDAGLGHLETLLYPSPEPFSAEPFMRRCASALLHGDEVSPEAGSGPETGGEDAACAAEASRQGAAQPFAARTDSVESQEGLLTPPMAPRGPRRDSPPQGAEAPAEGVGSEAQHCEQSSAIWRWKVTLRSHLDAVRCVSCHEDALVSCGEDGLVKVWDMTNFRRSHCEPQLLEGTEPYATHRGHAGAVLSLARNPEENIFFTGGQDASIRAWRLLPPGRDPYEPGAPRPAASQLGRLGGHDDAVWALAGRAGTGLLASASADGTVRLWRAEAAAEAAVMEGVEEPPAELRALALPAPGGGEVRDVPTSLAWTPRAGPLLLAGFMSSVCAVFDVENGTVLRCPGASAAGPAATSLACHPALDLAVAGHADGCARAFCPSTGQATLTLSGHGAAVSAVAADPRGGFTVATGSHDGCLRLFDLRTGGCLCSAELHRRKFDEAVHCVVHAGEHLVTAGADSNIVMLRLLE